VSLNIKRRNLFMMFDIEMYLPEGIELKEKNLGEEPFIHKTAMIRKCKIGSWTDIGPNVSLMETEVGDYTYFAGEASSLYATIGKFCSIASHVRINPSNHPMWRVTQHHSTYRRKQYGFDTINDEEFFNWRRKDHVEIGHDVWIGHGAIIMPGVKIGTGAIIGSGAVVTKDVIPYGVAVGVPAKVIRKRFDDETIEKIMKTSWWEWDRKTLEERFKDMFEVGSFLNKYYLGD
jgi:phosphonate metabolism protein (transferase hexapeptide repeat family)